MELYYDIATEGARFDNLKQKVKTIFEKIKMGFEKIIMIIKNFIAKLSKKILKVETFKVNRKYYSDIMNIIHKVEAMDVSYSTKIKAYVAAATFDKDKINEIYTEIANKLQDLADLTSNAKQTQAPSSGPTIEIVKSHYEKMRNRFMAMQQICISEMQKISLFYQALIASLTKNGKATDELKDGVTITEYVNIILSVTSKNARVNFIRASLLIELVNMIDRNVIHDDSQYDDLHEYKNARYKNVKKESSHTNQGPSNYTRLTDKTLESFIDFCDEYQISEESLSKAKSMYKKESKYIEQNGEDIENMPETTKSEIEAKIHAIELQRKDIKDLINRISSEKVNLADRLISFAAKSIKADIDIGTFLTGASLYMDALHLDTSIYHIWRKLAFIIGATKGRELLSKATVKNRKQFINNAINELKLRDKILVRMESSLNAKLAS